MTTKEIRSRKDYSSPLVTVQGFTDANRLKWVKIKHGRQSALIEYSAFASDQGAIWSDLSQKGLIIVSRAVKSEVIEQVEALGMFERRTIFARPGWREGQFVNASGKVFAPNGATKGWVAFIPNRLKCSRRGTHQKWVKGVADLLEAHPIPCFFIMVAFAAPMLELSGRTDNIGFELAGEGGKGKTTVQRIMTSVVGPAMEKDRGYITTFQMTPAAFERSMRWHSDMPFIIDEANLFGSGEGGRADKRKMRDFSFQMSSGTTKGRFDNPQQEGFRFVFVTSANEPFNELLGETHTDVANAATDRLMSITVPEGDAGVFGALPSGYDSYRQFTLALETAMSQQYGTAMPMFLKKLVEVRQKDEKQLKAMIRRKIDLFKAEVGVNENNGSDVRVAEAFGLVYAAGDLARHFGILPPDFDCLGSAKHCYANFRNTVPIRQSLRERLISIANRPETMRIEPKKLPELSNDEVAKIGAFIRECKGETLLLMATAFGQKMFPDWNAIKGTADFVALNRANDNGRGRGFHCRIRSNKKSDWFYCFKMPEYFDPDEQVKQADQFKARN